MVQSNIKDVVFNNIDDRKELGLALKNWLDIFYMECDAAVRKSMLDCEPPLTEWPEFNAYVAAVVEKLSMDYQLPQPEWIFNENRFLKYGWYPEDTGSRTRKILFTQSPAAFRRRGLFVSHDAIDRASKFHGPETCGLQPN